MFLTNTVNAGIGFAFSIGSMPFLKVHFSEGLVYKVCHLMCNTRGVFRTSLLNRVLGVLACLRA